MMPNVIPAKSQRHLARPPDPELDRLDGHPQRLPVAMGHEWEPKDPWVRSMKLLKEEVLPRLP